MLFLVQVVFGYSNNYEKSNLNSICAIVSFGTEPNRHAHNPIESGTDTSEQEEKEGSQKSQESQESEENEETEELEVVSGNSANQQYSFQFSEMNYYYLFKPSEGISKEQYYPPECKV
jgi:hypothetical protein